MQLADTACIEPHIYAGDVLGDSKLPHRNLASPSARFETHMGVREGEAQIGKRAVIGRRGSQYVRVFTVPQKIAGTVIGAAPAWNMRLRDLVVRFCRSGAE